MTNFHEVSLLKKALLGLYAMYCESKKGNIFLQSFSIPQTAFALQCISWAHLGKCCLQPKNNGMWKRYLRWMRGAFSMLVSAEPFEKRARTMKCWGGIMTWSQCPEWQPHHSVWPEALPQGSVCSCIKFRAGCQDQQDHQRAARYAQVTATKCLLRGKQKQNKAACVFYVTEKHSYAQLSDNRFGSRSPGTQGPG